MVKPVKHSEGREFYDDGYSSEEEELQNRIDFWRVSFQGREQELNTLNAAYSTLAGRSDVGERFSTPVTLVSGLSGTGKSSLVSKFFQGLKTHPAGEKKVEPRCLVGKYNEFTFAKPFSAIADALSGLLSSILHGDEDHLFNFRKDVRKKVGSEVTALASLVPEINVALRTSRNYAAPLGAQENAWNRVKYAFQSFFTAICTKHNPVIMFLDDLQWADTASLELIEALLADKSLRYFMLIGGIRLDEVNDDHPVTELMQSIASMRRVQKIRLENLSLEATENILAEVLEVEVSEVHELAAKLYTKTGGNIFFTKQAIDELARKNIVFYCHISFQWRWNLDDIDEGITDNVVATILSKMKTAPENLQKALSTAAYTRASFDVDTLHNLMESIGYRIELDELLKNLDAAVVTGLLTNRVGSRVFRFSHDRIQQAALMLVPEGGERSALSMALGRKLYELGKEKDKSWMLFAAADHLNATSLQHIDPLFMANLNLEVGEHSMNVAAFSQASIYLKKGVAAVEMLNLPWNHHYRLILKIYRALADVELCQGNYDYGQECAEQVLKNATNLTDKLPTYIATTHALGRQDCQNEAFSCCRNVAIEMGIYPKSFLPIHLVKHLVWAKSYFKDHTDEDIIKIPKAAPEKALHLQSICQQIVIRGKMLDRKLDFLLASMVTMKFGLKGGHFSGFTIQAIALYAAFLLSTGDHQGSARVAQLTRRLCGTHEGIESECWVSLLLGMYVISWNLPHTEVLPVFRRGFVSGMEIGEIECAFMNEFGLTQGAFLAGFPLSALERSATKAMEQVNLYGVKSTHTLIDSYRIIIQCLTGSIDYMDILRNYHDCTLVQHQHNRNDYLVGVSVWLMISVYFGEFDIAADIVKKVDAAYLKSGASYTGTLIRWLFQFLTFTGLAKKGKTRKYRKQANNVLREMMKSGRPLQGSTVHRLKIMEAEKKALNSSSVLKVRKAYDDAILSAIESGCIQDAALCCELAGESFLRIGDDDLPVHYFSHARSYYESWGAAAKVRHLEQKRGPFLNADKVVAVSTMYQKGMMKGAGLRTSHKEDGLSRQGSRDGLSIDSTTATREERSFWNESNPRLTGSMNLDDLEDFEEFDLSREIDPSKEIR